jgi:transcriptional regulator with XRE-family HTH domain
MTVDVKLSYRLLELRREHGYTQERLAELLHTDIQTISLWEQAKSIPDNVMIKRLGELYGIPGGDLLSPPEDAKPEPAPERRPSPGEGSPVTKKVMDKPTKARIIDTYPVLVLILFLSAGFLFDAWGTAWLMFLSIPILTLLLTAYGDGQYSSGEIGRRFLSMAYPVLTAAVFLSLGVMFGVWHPTWMLFLTIPLFYILRPKAE